jgi:hypothetical protein
MFDRARSRHTPRSSPERSPASGVARGRVRVDGVLDLLAVPHCEHWARVEGAMRRLDAERGRPWRLKLLLPDTPEAATALPRLVARLGDAGMAHDSGRAPGGAQLLVEARRAAPAPRPVAA